MARNGSGTYVKVGDNVIFDTVISETYYNNQINDLVAALTQSVSKDGQTTITGNLNMGSRKLTAMAVGTAATDSVSLAQVQAGAFGYVASDSGSSNAYVIAPSPAITGFAAGQKFAFLAANVSSGASTLNVSGLGVKNVYYQNAAISGAMIKAGALILVVYDGTQFQMLSPANTFLSGTVAIANGGTGATSAAAAATALGVGTGSSPQFTAVNIGAATDTTITRVSAGVIAVEGTTILDTADIGVAVQAYDADTLKADVDDTLTAGFAATDDNDGTKSSGTYTPTYAGGNFKLAVNGGAHTLAPQSGTGNIVIQYTNNGSAGTITTSGWTIVTGDDLTTTDGHDFLFFCTVVAAFKHLNVVALQ